LPDVVWLDGRIVPASEARIGIEDRGFLYGEALFETLRAYGGVVFRLGDHLARYRRSARFLGFPERPDDAALAAAVEAAIRASGCADAYLRLTVTGGTGRGLARAPATEPTVLVEARRLSPYPAELYERGARLIVSRCTRPAGAVLLQHKTPAYLPAILARREAAAAGADDALFLNSAGRVTEATVSNLFAVIGGEVVTPPVADGVLPGVTRAVVMDLCRAAGVACREGSLTLEDLRGAEEAFLTNTLMEVMPVAGVAGGPAFGDVPGPVTRDLARRYRRRVAAETV